MQPNVNINIKIVRELGKKLARYFDDRSQHATTGTDFNPSHHDFFDSLRDKFYHEMEKAYYEGEILDLNTATEHDLAAFGATDVLGYQLIDGFDNFINNIPLFSLGLCHFRNGQIQHAVVFNPLTDETFQAIKGMGAQLNGRRLRIHNAPTLTIAYVNKLRLAMHPALPPHGIRILGAHNLELAFLAANRADIALHHNSSTLSSSLGKLIAKEAGATCFTLQNNQLSLYGPLDQLKKFMDYST